MAREEINYNLESIIEKIQLGQNLVEEEEVFYLINAFNMDKQEAQRTIDQGMSQVAGILRD